MLSRLQVTERHRKNGDAAERPFTLLLPCDLSFRIKESPLDVLSTDEPPKEHQLVDILGQTSRCGECVDHLGVISICGNRFRHHRILALASRLGCQDLAHLLKASMCQCVSDCRRCRTKD
jgi:hypothetical protein